MPIELVYCVWLFLIIGFSKAIVEGIREAETQDIGQFRHLTYSGYHWDSDDITAQPDMSMAAMWMNIDE
tara:strand:+ start:606 stop:812 length:207 start_codon:yes stop_codon:yes gene_type:complete